MPEAPTAASPDAGADERMLALEEALGNVRTAMHGRMEEMLSDLADDARALFGNRVKGASLFIGIVEVESAPGSEEFSPDELAPLRDAIRTVERSARLMRRNGLSDTTGTVAGRAAKTAEALAILAKAPDVIPEPGDEAWDELPPPSPTR